MQKKDYSEWKPNPNKDASASAIETACSLIANCLYRPSDLPKGQSLFGMRFNIKRAYLDYFKSRPEKPMPSQVENQHLFEIIELNKAPKPEGAKFAPWIDDIDYANNKKILESFFPKLFESIQLAPMKAGAASPKRDAEIDALKKQVAELKELISSQKERKEAS